MKNWTARNVIEARNNLVQIKSGTLYTVRLYADGWAVWEQGGGIDKVESLEAWDFARWLNDRQAVIFVA